LLDGEKCPENGIMYYEGNLGPQEFWSFLELVRTFLLLNIGMYIMLDNL